MMTDEKLADIRAFFVEKSFGRIQECTLEALDEYAVARQALGRVRDVLDRQNHQYAVTSRREVGVTPGDFDDLLDELESALAHHAKESP